VSRESESDRIEATLRRLPGLWVAIRDGEAVEAHESPYALAMRLHERGITDAAIVRAPATDEPITIGVG
jgi:hypothetical protein